MLMAAAVGGGLCPRPWVERVEAGLQRSVAGAGLEAPAKAADESGEEEGESDERAPAKTSPGDEGE